MTAGASEVVARLWHFCNVLRDDGLSYPDYVEQLTYLLFLKLADEQDAALIPEVNVWSSLTELDADSLRDRYEDVLRLLGQRDGTLGLIFSGATNKIADPAKLRYLAVDLIGRTEWTGLSDDVKGDAYEGLLEKNARDTKSGAGQYFTPRPLIDAIVECVRPLRTERVLDPACGTGGFLLGTHEHTQRSAEDAKREGKGGGVRGVELVREVARLAAMNLFLHGVGSAQTAEVPILCADSLRLTDSKGEADVILTNPPFGTRGTVTFSPGTSGSVTGDELTVHRPDFWIQTANKQLGFLQHIVSTLASTGRAAVVVPDNVLFEAGAAAEVRRRLIETCNLHTLLRLPAGLFYASGVTANVLFFDRSPNPNENLWVYDLRSGNHFSLKTRPIAQADFREFTAVFRPDDRSKRASTKENPRWRAFSQEELLRSDAHSLDLSWPIAEQGPAPGLSPGMDRMDQLAREIIDELDQAMRHIANASPPDIEREATSE